MDSCSQMSVDSDDSIPRNVCEEVVVDSTIQSMDAKNVAMASESEDETYDDEIGSNSRESSTSPPLDDTLKSRDQSKVNASSTPVQQHIDNYRQIPVEEHKTEILKLVLKKSPEYQLVNPSPNSPNHKIILLANASPTYSVSTSDGKKTTFASNNVDTKESSTLDDNPDEEAISEELLRLSQDQNRPLKTYGRPKTSLSSKVDEQTTDADKIGTKDETDADSVKSEPEKPSTPKITRELQQLQKTVNESKVLSEYMNDSGMKSRKTRKMTTGKGVGGESEELPVPHRMRSRSRSCSKSRIDSPTEDKSRSWPVDEKTSKRQNMRSQNSEFVQKQIKFLNSIQGGGDDGTDNSDCETSMTDGKSSSHSESQPIGSKRELLPPPKPGWDMFCFKCHTGGDLVPCSKCVRSYHMKCVKTAAMPKVNSTWNCPECLAIESSLKTTQTRLKTNVFLENLTQLLLFALKRMKQSKGFEHFLTEFSDDEYPDYSKYIACPMTLEKLQDRIEEKCYKCTEEFAVDTKWILHNSSVYFGNNSKVTNFAKGIVKVCRQELTEIDTCSECYYNANTRRDWFVQVCSRPHMLLWAKLKGFPYWPAKAMGIQGALVNVRFFGDHDRAYVPIKECFLYSEMDPNPTKQNKKSIKECIKEVDIHIRKIITLFGTFVYPPFRTVYDPTKELDQMEILIPGLNEFMKNVEKSPKPALTYKIVKSADNHLSIIKKDSEKITTDSVSSNSSTLVSNTNDVVAQSADGDKVRKQRFESIDSSHSNNEVTSTCETTTPVENSPSTGHMESASSSSATVEAKPAEKTVAPLKIQERIDSESTTKTYEVVPKVSDTNQAKVNSVILKRKSDNWNAVSTVNTSKKQKTQVPVVEVGVVATNTLSAEITEPSTSSAETTTAVSATASNQPIGSTIKRKRSREEVSAKAQKPKLDENKIPPLVLLTTPFVLSSSNATLPTQSTVVSSIPIIPSNQNTGVTVTITQSPVVTSASNETPPSASNKPPTSSVALNSLIRFENSEISIKRLPKKTTTQPADVSPQTTVNTDKSKEKAAESTTAVTQPTVSETDTSQTATAATPADLTKSNEVLDANKSNSNKEPNSRVSELIPFDEIKTEKPDSDELVVEVRSKTATPEQQPPPPDSHRNSVGTIASNSSDSFRPVVIKAEVMSDDEDLSNPSRSEENCDSESSASNAKTSELQTAGNVASAAANVSQKTGKPETKKQRARKSFPNKGNFNPVVLANHSNPSAAKSRPILPQPLLPQNNGMVYIPVDSKTAATGKQNFPTSSSATSSATPKAVVNSISITPCPSSSSSIATIAGFSIHNAPGAGSPMNTRVTPLAPTILTTSVQLPIVYSTLPLSGAMNGPIMNPPPTNGGAQLQATCTMQPNPAPVTSEQHMLSGFVTPTLASAITEAIVRGPPKLAPRPAGPLRSEGDYVFPTEAGPVSKILADNAHKMTDFFRSVIEDTLSDMAKNQSAEAKVRLMEMELEKVKYTHEKELAELKHNTDMMLCEMRKSLENEKTRLVAETRKQCELERIRAVEEAKTKQWCAACGKEAQFYCCWNTSYCDYPCQQKHWTRHMTTCAQKDNTDANAQRVGVKIAQYNPSAVDKTNKSKELVSPKPYLPMGTRPAKITPVTKHSVATAGAFKRLLPIQTQPAPRYAVINSNEWNLVPTPQFQRGFPTTGLIVSDAVTKSIPGKCSINMIQSPKM